LIKFFILFYFYCLNKYSDQLVCIVWSNITKVLAWPQNRTNTKNPYLEGACELAIVYIYIYIYIFSAKASSCTHFAAKVSELVYKGNLTRHLGSLGCWKWQWNGWWDVVHCVQEEKRKGDENKETSSSNRRILSSFYN